MNESLTKQMKKQLLSQRNKKKSWYDIFRERIPNMNLSFDLVFTKNKRARKEFELILSDFYLRPDYWSALFDAVFTSKDAFQFGTVSASELNPVVASQFALISDDILLAGYIDKSFLSGISVNIFENLRADLGYQAASRFYREYFQRVADDKEILFFWHLILNSVIRDYLDQTDRRTMNRAFEERKRFIEKNTPTLQKMIESGTTLDVRLDKVPIPLSQYNLERTAGVALEILLDVTSNWFFELPLKNKKIYAVGPRYIARNYSNKDYILILEGQSVIKARSWIDRMINQKSFNTLFYEDSYFTPGTVLLNQKPTKKYTVRTIDKEWATQYIKEHHSDIPEVSPRGFLYGVGVFDPDDKIVGVAVLNTSSAPPRGGGGQYHIVELSRIAIPETHRGEGISGILTSWLIENKELFNRSEYGTVNVVTFSLLRQPGTIYESTKELHPIGLVKPASRSGDRVNVLSTEWKIRWETNPLNENLIREYLPKLHPIFMKATYGIHAWTGLPVSPILSGSDFRWRHFGSIQALSDVAKVFDINKNTWKSRSGKSFKAYVREYNNDKLLKELLDELIFTINNTQKRLKSK